MLSYINSCFYQRTDWVSRIVEFHWYWYWYPYWYFDIPWQHYFTLWGIILDWKTRNLLLACTLLPHTACSENFVFALQCEVYHLRSDRAEHPGGKPALERSRWEVMLAQGLKSPSGWQASLILEWCIVCHPQISLSAVFAVHLINELRMCRGQRYQAE